MFDEKKATQAAAYFLLQSNGTMSHLKLMKLLYLADRLSLDSYEFTITGDKFYSLDYGPVLSKTKDLLDGNTIGNIWQKWITDKSDHKVELVNRSIHRDDLINLSDADIGIIDTIWHEYGHMDQWEIAQFTHDNCKEWKNPNGSSLPIKLQDILLALGRNRHDAKNIVQQIEEQEYLNALLS